MIHEHIVETHHMVDDQTKADEAFQVFLQKFSHTNVTVYDEYMVYSIRVVRLVDQIKKEAEKVIKDNKLPLTIRINKSTFAGTMIIEKKL